MVRHFDLKTALLLHVFLLIVLSGIPVSAQSYTNDQSEFDLGLELVYGNGEEESIFSAVFGTGERADSVTIKVTRRYISSAYIDIVWLKVDGVTQTASFSLSYTATRENHGDSISVEAYAEASIFNWDTVEFDYYKDTISGTISLTGSETPDSIPFIAVALIGLIVIVAAVVVKRR
jgi:hypothetical protein